MLLAMSVVAVVVSGPGGGGSWYLVSNGDVYPEGGSVSVLGRATDGCNKDTNNL